MADDPLLEWLGRLSSAFREAGVRHALAGGLAVAVWAQPRATADIDVVLVAEPPAVELARTACERLGLLQTKRAIASIKRLRLLRMLVPPGEGPEPIGLDLLLVDPELERDVLRRAVAVPMGGYSVPVVTAEDLVLLKLLRLSDQDRVDIRAVSQSRKLDRRYLDRQARRFRLRTRLVRALGAR